MNETKMNCWEFKKCGREIGGKNASEGVCPAAVDRDFDGVHEGENAGRSCWVVTGTLCDGQLQGDYKEKREGCLYCIFYQLVREEEIPLFSVISVILDRKKIARVELTDSPQHCRI